MLIWQIYLFDSKNPNPVDPYNVLQKQHILTLF
jgi:hypothetical protein